jgi:arylsulfatase A-like enzyme
MSKPSALPGEVVMLSEVLKENGYATGGIVSNINLAPSFGFDQGYDEYHYLAPDYLAGAEESSSKLILYQIARSVWFKIQPGLRFGDFYQDSEVVNGVALDFLERYADSRFFLFLHYMDPHDPYFRHPYDGHGIARVSNQHPDPGLAEEMQRLYEGEIEYLDRNLGRLFARIRELGLWDDTVIALTADHGEEFHEHGGFWHGLTLYDEQIQVPLLVKWARGERSASDPAGHVVRSIDVMPTLLARAGVPAPDALQGVDLAGDLDARAEKDRIAFSEEDHEGNVLRSVRTTDWKLIEANAGNPRGLPPVELFHVRSDAGETEDLHGRDGSVASDLRAKADAHEQFARSRAVEGEGAALSSADEDALRALGYID